MTKNFTSDSYSSIDLLHLGRDHFYLGISLLSGSTPQSINLDDETIMFDVFDSSGLLVHLGIELTLKAIILEHEKMFTDFHQFSKKIKVHDCLKDIFNEDDHKTLDEIDEYFNCRYGAQSSGNNYQIPEIGNESVKIYLGLYKKIISKLPNKLREKYENLSPYTKCGRRLLEKKL